MLYYIMQTIPHKQEGNVGI